MWIKKDVFNLVNIIVRATDEVLDVYNSKEFGIIEKDDKSPLTIADKKSHECILDGLSKLDKKFPVLSEEGKEISYEERKRWEYFWLIDPLDGTKEFIKKNGEFTINIALIEKDKPILGLVSVPARKEIYFAVSGIGAYKIKYTGKTFINNDELYSNAVKLPFKEEREEIIVVGSRSHLDEKTEKYIESIKKIGSVSVISLGSSFKICYLAEGKADVYPRYGKTMEWDIAAGHIILEEAGGKIINAETFERIRYNKINLENPPFIAKSYYFLRKYEK
jgi:3'(2'), 5'-bisphosphate nucleotidase